VSIGLTGNFVFGKNSETWKILWDNSSEISSSNSQYSVRHTGYGWTVGIQMQPLPYLKLGGTVSPSYRIHSATDLYYGFYLDKKDSHFQFPLCWNAAALAALGKNASWGLEYSEQQWNRFSMIQDLRKSRSIATGGEFYGLKNPMAPYLKKMAYRIGFSYKPFFCPDISGNTINEYWGTLGFGFPLASGISQVDAAFGIGKRGSTKTNAFSEMLYQIGVTVTVGEKWQGQGE
jgi:hypothetical protein